MKKAIIILLILGFGFSTTFAQKQTTIKIQERSIDKPISTAKITSRDKFSITETISEFTIQQKIVKEGAFNEIIADGMQKTYSAGNPDLPVFAKLIEIPANNKVQITVLNYKEKLIALSDHDIYDKIFPAQESVSKSDDPEKVPFKLNKEVYERNSYFKNEFVTFDDRGYLRNKHLGYIQISPFEYNPVTNMVLVKYDFEIEVKFVSDNKSNVAIDSRLNSLYFQNLPIQTINTTSDSKALIQGPVKYVIVSDTMFAATLQPFIEWKKLKGFNVVTAYTSNPLVGNTASTIKAYLKELYDNPSDGISPTFVLLVGDVAQIPASSTSGHYSDLYYYEYTGDKLPEVFGGRFSATTIGQLQPQIDKTLLVEKYLMPNKAYLNNVVLVAGVDPQFAPTFGNGFVNYANAYYINAGNGFNSLSYLYPASGSADEQIRANISSGVALANYTAHCSSSGWADPTFSIEHIAQMTNVDMYPLMIGNCCQSVTFGGNSFGEEILRAANKGAVGYIGASNNTYWDEDYFWGIGVAPISANPTYAESGLGAYDRFFHLNGENKSDWFITQGQINVAGNLAVEASSSSRKTYYWEIYHLMGDPSLTPFVKVPSAMLSSFNSEIIVGSSTFELTTEEDAYVAFSYNNTLLDAKMAGSDGKVELSFSPLAEVGQAKLVITKQNRIPVIQTIEVIPATTPYVITEQIIINDELGNNNSTLEYGENIKLSIQLKNVSKIYDAYSVNAVLSSEDSCFVFVDSLQNFGTILTDTVSFIENAFQFELKRNIPDQHLLKFNLDITGTDVDLNPYTWNSKVNFTINAPKLEIGDLIIDDSGFNENGILDPGETVILKWIVKNTGHTDINGLNGLLEYISGSTLATIDQGTTEAFALVAGEKDTLEFTVSASALENYETPVEFKISLVDNLFDYYTVSENSTLIIGQAPEYKISEGGKKHVYYSALFYDSGGKENNYKDYENYTITFLPEQGNGFIKVEFNSFDVEKKDGGGCWDYLSIYNDTTSNALNKFGDFCSDNPPTEYIATNSSGALTFKFYSDVSIVKSGWEARITIVNSFTVKFVVTASGNPIENALVSFNLEEKYTNSSGEVEFKNIPADTSLTYEIRKRGYANATGTIDVTSDITEAIELVEGTAYYNVEFIITDGTNPVGEALIVFDGKEGLTNLDGVFVFDSITYGTDKVFVITKDKFFDYRDTVDVDSNLMLNIQMKLEVYSVTFNVASNASSSPLEGVDVNFNSETLLTNSNGVAIFSNVEPKSGLGYSLSKTGFYDLTGSIDITNENKTLNLTMSVISSVNDINQESVSVFPNPSQGIINIRLGEIKENIQINVYDVIGKSVYSKNIPIVENTEIIDLTNQPKGLYFVSIKSSTGEIVSKKILIK